MKKEIKLGLLLSIILTSNPILSINVEPFKAYMPRADALNILADIKYLNKTDGTKTKEPEKLRSYEEMDKVSDAISFKKFISEGFFEKEKKAYFYIYKQKSKSRTNTGIICKVLIDDYINGKIKKHEKIIDSKANFAQKIIKIQNAHIEPILLSYKENYNIKNIIIKKTTEYPDLVFKDKNKVKHLVWKITDKKNIKEIKKSFKKIPNLYIADGHHRSAASAILNKTIGIKYMTAALFSDQEITIYPYHRMMKNLNNLSKKEFFKIIKENFIVCKTSKKTVPKKNIRMFFNTKWYTLKYKYKRKNKNISWSEIKDIFKTDYNKIRKNIPSNLFHKKIVSKIFGTNMEKINTIMDYISGSLSIDKIISKYEKENYKVLFLLPAILPNDFLKIVSCKKNLPPKATWIEPKIKAGIFVRELS